MILYCESEGAGTPVVILHGLMGACENWRAVRRALSDRFRVFCLDLPNHGRSPHAAHTDLDSMGGDVLETLAAQGVAEPFVLIGHSMGGKVAMRLASERPDRVRGLVVVDISPRAIQPVHLFVLRACQGLDLAAASRREALDAALAESLPQRETRDFLLKNVVRDAEGRFAWRVSLPYLIDNYRCVSDAVPFQTPYAGPSLFVAGEQSPFRLRNDEALIRTWFPAARFATIPGAGHLVHTDQPAAFLSDVRAFLDTCVR
jgi:esterase